MENTSKWNQPQKAAKRTKSGVAVWRGVIAALVVVVGAVIAFWLIGGRNAEDVKPKEKPQAKTSLDTPKARTAVGVEARPQEENDASAKAVKPPPQRFGQYEVEVDEKGERWIYRDGKRRHIMSVNPGTSRQLFYNRAENQLSALLTVKPGEMIVGFDIDEKRFVKDFLASLETPIKITDEDTPEEREEKMLVMEAKEQLAKYYREGQDIVKIMRDEYREVAKLNAVKTDLSAEINKARREGASAEEIEIKVAAANEILKQYGIDHKFKLLRTERIAFEGLDSH